MRQGAHVGDGPPICPRPTNAQMRPQRRERNKRDHHTSKHHLDAPSGRCKDVRALECWFDRKLEKSNGDVREVIRTIKIVKGAMLYLCVHTYIYRSAISCGARVRGVTRRSGVEGG